MTNRRRALFAVTIASILAADQFTKWLVRSAFAVGESRPIVPGVVWLTHVKNSGAAFGMFRGQQWLLIAVAVVVLGAISYAVTRIKPESLLVWIALAMIAAGTCGNLIDRAVSGGVTDFLDLGWFPVFNVADISLDVGVALLLWWLLLGSEHRDTKPVAQAPDTTEALPADE